jgi:hypothetical protein
MGGCRRVVLEEGELKGCGGGVVWEKCLKMVIGFEGGVMESELNLCKM